jgi:hypothetical protein
MAFKRSWVRFPPAPPQRLQGVISKGITPSSFPQPTLRQRVLLAPLYEQHEGSQKRASLSTRKRALEFFSRGRPTRRLFAPARVFVRNLPHGCMRKKAHHLLGDFQAVVGSWPSSLSWEPVSTRTFGHYRCIGCTNSQATYVWRGSFRDYLIWTLIPPSAITTEPRI